jgi:Peptidase family M23
MEPRRPSGGTLTRLTIDRLDGHADSVVSVVGEMAGEPLHFLDAGTTPGGDKLEALGAIPVEVSDSVVANVVVGHASGKADTLRLKLDYPHQAPPPSAMGSRGKTKGASRLRVDRRFTARPDSATEARVEHENELARNVGRKAQDTPALWRTEAFTRPRSAKVTSKFGSGRVFNGRVSSSHLGVDYRGAMGDPIYAANRGVVALVDTFFLAGNVVYINHGDGLVTGYFHMSQPEVAIGDTVEKGQEIGRVGATGRVTGPHLHWSARFGALTIDPADLLSLGPPFVAAPATSKASGRSTTSARKRSATSVAKR